MLTEAIENWINGNRKDALRQFGHLTHDEQVDFADVCLDTPEHIVAALLLALAEGS